MMTTSAVPMNTRSPGRQSLLCFSQRSWFCGERGGRESDDHADGRGAITDQPDEQATATRSVTASVS
jgi:hypothetical protein